MRKPIRVLIVDDSNAYRELLRSIVENAAHMQVVGVAVDGVEAVEMAQRLKPDVITMDIHMPRMNGIEATREIMMSAPCPIVMVSASVHLRERHLTIEALASGALSIIDKPSLFAPPAVIEALVDRIRLMSEVKVVRRWTNHNAPQTAAPPEPPPKPRSKSSTLATPTQRVRAKVIAIAASTGGPAVLGEIVRDLPPDLSLPVLIVQHITVGFGSGFALWLNQQTSLTVQLAQAGQRLTGGQILIAPDDHHLTLDSTRRVQLNQYPKLHSVRPAADYLFKTVAERYGAESIGVILTGMGRDGAVGLEAMRQAGSYTIAQDRATSVVFGMPNAAIERGAVRKILPSSQIATELRQVVQHGWMNEKG